MLKKIAIAIARALAEIPIIICEIVILPFGLAYRVYRAVRPPGLPIPGSDLDDTAHELTEAREEARMFSGSLSDGEVVRRYAAHKSTSHEPPAYDQLQPRVQRWLSDLDSAELKRLIGRPDFEINRHLDPQHAFRIPGVRLAGPKVPARASAPSMESNGGKSGGGKKPTALPPELQAVLDDLAASPSPAPRMR